VTTLSFFLCIVSLIFYIHISTKTKELNKLSLFNVIVCCIIYFTSRYDVILFFIILLNSSYSYHSSFKSNIQKSKEFIAFVELFKNKIPSEEYQTITREFFCRQLYISSYNKSIKNIIIAINITSLLIVILTIAREHYGL